MPLLSMVNCECVTNVPGKLHGLSPNQSCLTAYCTGLLMARRALKALEMDEEYQGNTEVWQIQSAICYVGLLLYTVY